MKPAYLPPPPTPRLSRSFLQILFLSLLCYLSCCGELFAASSNHTAPDDRTDWVAQMKSSERGPFSRIRWFCKDGSVHPPKPYACKDLGGGVQHGEWSAQTKSLRADGYYIANLFADLDDTLSKKIVSGDPLFAQMLIEQFLIGFDDGWILRKAQYYRGAFQDEDERAGARELLHTLSAQSDWVTYRYLVLRTAARYLDHGAENASVQEVRQLSASLSEENNRFKTLRAKIHGRPQKSDAAAVREFVKDFVQPEDSAPYLKLADLIDEIYASDLVQSLGNIATGQLPAPIKNLLDSASKEIAADKSIANQLAVTAKTLAELRDALELAVSAKQRVQLLDLSLALESAFFASASSLVPTLETLTRREQLSLTGASINAIYGAGLISKRQRSASHDELKKLAPDQVTASTYKDALEYLSLLPSWGTQNLRLFFGHAMAKLTRIEPKANLYIQDHLRGSPLFFYATLVDNLVRDANKLIGVSNVLFGDNVGAGLRSLNPGITNGVLSIATGDNTASLDKKGIYLLPETVSELPPVAGILTEGEGNPLSHVQLLARNLGIPNVGVDQSLIPILHQHKNTQVVLAVSPAGSVRLTDAKDTWAKSYLETKREPEKTLIQVNLDKLNLSHKDFATLSELRANDSGRTVGPKAAKLGELKHFYPEAVAEGLAIPFGVFREILDTTRHSSGQSLFGWMVDRYNALATMPETSRDKETEIFRAQLESAIADTKPNADFQKRLKQKLTEVFGSDGSYGVFVRSDTNVEDLPGFTGAGLNLTVANVVGFDNILKAITRVWASPFTARSFAWRQSLMDKPEHVYPAVLLMLSVNADKSGVLVTQDIDSGDNTWLSVAINEGVGGAVDGQSAESLRINMSNGQVRLMAAATAPIRRQIDLNGGVAKLPVSSNDRVLNASDIAHLIAFARELPNRFPAIVDAEGEAAPADIEFGFLDGELRLFQIRPFLDSVQAQGNGLLQSLDLPLAKNAKKIVELNASASP